MQKDVLKQAKILESNIDVYTDTMTRVETGSVRVQIYRAGFNQSISPDDLDKILGDESKTLTAVTTMLLKQFLQTKIEESQAALDNL